VLHVPVPRDLDRVVLVEDRIEDRLLGRRGGQARQFSSRTRSSSLGQLGRHRVRRCLPAGHGHRSAECRKPPKRTDQETGRYRHGKPHGHTVSAPNRPYPWTAISSCGTALVSAGLHEQPTAYGPPPPGEFPTELAASAPSPLQQRLAGPDNTSPRKPRRPHRRTAGRWSMMLIAPAGGSGGGQGDVRG